MLELTAGRRYPKVLMKETEMVCEITVKGSWDIRRSMKIET